MRGAPPASGAEALCRALERRGVSCVFGLPGTQNVALYEALRRSSIRTVLATHELAASFMANGYFRASGRVAPLVTIGGPGFAFALPGLAEAHHDSAAVLHIACQPPRGARRFLFQALDQRRMAGPVTKAIVPLDRPEEAASRAGEALDLALAGEPGPVLLEWAPEALGPGPLPAAELPAAPAPPEPDAAQVEELLGLVRAARRPLILAGQGAAGAAPLVQRLAEALGAPVATTLSGRGTLPEDHPLALGFELARGAVDRLNQAAASADLILVLGCKLGAAGTGLFAIDLPQDRLARVDASAEVLESNYPCRLGVLGDVGAVLARLLAALGPREPAAGWGGAELQRLRAALRGARDAGGPEPVVHGVTGGRPERLFSALRAALPREGIAVADSGMHQELLRRHFDVLAPRGLVAPADFQSMAFALPAAIGARLAAPARPVVAVLGDGGLLMSGMEILTAVREGVSLVAVVLNDGRLNRIRLQQLASYGAAVSTDVLTPDLPSLAEALGARHALVDGEPERVFREALSAGGVTLVEVLVGDSPAIHAARLKGAARAAARRIAGPRLLARARGLLRRR